MEKFIHFHLFTFIIFSILLVIVLGNANSLSSLNLTYIKEAKERFMSLDPTKLPDPPMPPYSFIVYHRDIFEKSKFKDYDSLFENRLARSDARASYLGSVLESKNRQEGGILQRMPKATAIHFETGEYLASFSLGSQMIKNFLVIDTGSDLIWWQCGPCEANKCYKQDLPLYDSRRSKTFRIPSCKDYASTCNTESPEYYCNPTNSQCTYTIYYADSRQSKGVIAEDEITFGLDNSPVNVIFGCSDDQRGKREFEGFAAGFLGLGRALPRGYSLPSQFDVKIMSICLPTFYSGKLSVLSFGSIKWPRVTSAKLLINKAYPSFYYVDIYKIFINDREIPVDPSWWEFRPNWSGGMLVDVGATYTYFPHDYYIIFRDIFREEARLIPMAKNPVPPFDTCYNHNPYLGDLYFPEVKLMFGDMKSNSTLILSKGRVIVTYQGLYCLAFKGWYSASSILGMNQLQGVGLTFDYKADTLSFDIDACD